MQLRLIPLLVLIAAAILAATAGGSSQPLVELSANKVPEPTDLAKSEELWATINVCDTADNPDTIGIRGSMPGLGNKPAKLQMRFQVQFKAKSDGEWKDAGDNADSGWQTVGRTIRQVVESGQNFTFAPPADGGFHQLRGAVRYRWIREGDVHAYQRRITEPGHASTAGADPKGYSAGLCEIA